MTAVQANVEVAAPQSAHQSAHQGAHDGAHGYSYRKDDYRKCRRPRETALRRPRGCPLADMRTAR